MQKIIEKVINAGQDIADFAIDLDPTTTATTRAGHTVERVGKMDEGEVDHEVIALQLTKNSKRDNQYSADEIPTLIKLYQDTQSTVGITAAQSRALIRDQQKQHSPEGGAPDGALPA